MIISPNTILVALVALIVMAIMLHPKVQAFFDKLDSRRGKKK